MVAHARYAYPKRVTRAHPHTPPHVAAKHLGIYSAHTQ